LRCCGFGRFYNDHIFNTTNNDRIHNHAYNNTLNNNNWIARIVRRKQIVVLWIRLMLEVLLWIPSLLLVLFEVLWIWSFLVLVWILLFVVLFNNNNWIARIVRRKQI
jgi:hypothetical protein